MTTGSITTESITTGSITTGSITTGSTTEFTATTTSTSSTGRCPSAPVLLHSGSLDRCADQLPGYNCWPPNCDEGYAWLGGNITCAQGEYQVEGVCLQEDLLQAMDAAGAGGEPIVMTVDTVSAVIEVLHPDPESLPATAGDTGASILDDTWASQNMAILVEAIARVLDVDASLIRIQVLAESARRLIAEFDGRGSRRTSATIGASVLFRMRVILVLASEGLPEGISPENEAQVSELMGRLVAGGAQRLRRLSAASGSLLAAIANLLAEQGMALPAGLSTAYAEMPEPPQITRSTIIAVVRWVVGPFDPCPTTCGAGVQTRAVHCTTGIASQCGPEPEASKVCADYTGCPFNALCPGGPDAEGDCSSQVAGVTSSLAGLCICACCMMWLRLRYLFRPPTQGRWPVDIPEVVAADGSHSLSFEVVRAAASSRDTGSESRPSSSHGSDTKVRVIWDIDFDRTRDALRELISERTGLEDFDEEDLLNTLEQHHTISINPKGLKDSLNEFVPQFPDGCVVEFYSTSYCTWMLGRISLEFKRVVGGEPRCVYDVRLGSNQEKKDVALECLRHPLRPGERVDVLTDSGVEIGRVLSKMLSHGEGIFYRVAIEKEDDNMAGEATDTDEEADEATALLNSASVRRHFEEADTVNVYLGPKDGWCAANVGVDTSGQGGARMSGLLVHVNVLEAHGLRNTDLENGGMSDPYCAVALQGKPQSRFSTRVVWESLDPDWNQDGVLRNYVVGDAVEFQVWDRDNSGLENDELLGLTVLESDLFNIGGFQGELPLFFGEDDSNIQEAGSIRVEVSVQKAFDPYHFHHVPVAIRYLSPTPSGESEVVDKTFARNLVLPTHDFHAEVVLV